MSELLKKLPSTNAVNLFLNWSVVAFILIALLASAGCATTEYVYNTPPELRKVVIFNDSTDMVLQETGVFNQSVQPGERLEVNVGCYGRFSGVVDAYKIEGVDAQGNKSIRYFGQREYRVTVDGHEYESRGVKADAFIAFRGSSFSPLRSGRKYHLMGENPCSILTPSVRVKIGK